MSDDDDAGWGGETVMRMRLPSCWGLQLAGRQGAVALNCQAVVARGAPWPLGCCDRQPVKAPWTPWQGFR
jgi:hypothetical protein